MNLKFFFCFFFGPFKTVFVPCVSLRRSSICSDQENGFGICLSGQVLLSSSAIYDTHHSRGINREVYLFALDWIHQSGYSENEWSQQIISFMEI